MSQAMGFAIFAHIVTLLMVALGIIGGLGGWLALLMDKMQGFPTKVPYALYTLTLFVLIQIASQQVVQNSTYEVSVWVFFLPSGLACAATWLLARKASGSATLILILRSTSTLLLIIWGLVLLYFMAAE